MASGSISRAVSERKRHVQLLSKEENERIKAFRQGISLAARFGGSIDSLMHEACAARLELANRFLRAAQRELANPNPDYRRIISASYYSMYHRIRAVVYFHNDGDDHEEHSVLPRFIPGDFPDNTYWANELGKSRLRRNEADYELFVMTDAEQKKEADRILSEARKLRTIARRYLVKKGCTL